MSELNTRCFNPITGKRDGGYCVWEGRGKCEKCQAMDEIDQLRQQVDKLKADLLKSKLETSDHIHDVIIDHCDDIEEARQEMVNYSIALQRAMDGEG